MLKYEEVSLVLDELIHLDYDYYLYIITVENKEVGRLTFRLGSDELFQLDGHIGYEIEKQYRGNHYAYKACMALKPKILEYYDHVLITCDQDNFASKKTIEKLNAKYITFKTIPSKLSLYYPGSTGKCIYQWDMNEQSS